MKDKRDVVLIDGVRTVFAKAGTKLKNVSPQELGRTALKELIEKTNLDTHQVDEVLVGNVGNFSDAVNVSRVIALKAGVPKEVPAATFHRNCASALESIATGYDRLRSGSADVILAGGTENMSQMPLLFSQTFADIFSEFAFAKTMGKKLAALKKLKLKDLKPRIALMEGLTDPFVGINMGQTAEILAKEFNIRREEQDKFALRSHQRAAAAIKSGRMAEETTPVFLAPKYTEVIETDIGPREEQSLEALAKLKPFFDKRTGSITPGNSCPITDGAGFVLMMTREKAESLGYKPQFKIRGYTFAGLEPERMGLGPAYAIPKLLKKVGLTLKDMGLIEINEAFAAQVIACQMAMGSKKFAQEKLGWSDAVGEVRDDILNVNGGAIALGHPVGVSGTRLVITLMKEMQKRQVNFGVASLCIGGGQGGAMILEKEA